MATARLAALANTTPWSALQARAHADTVPRHAVASACQRIGFETEVLADTAWRQGRLGDELKRRALALLESGGDLPDWESAAEPAPPFQPHSVVWLSIDRIAREIGAQRPTLD